jgi:type II secretory pathway component PulM
MFAETRDEGVLVAIGVLSLALILYSVLIMQRLLAGVGVVIPLVVLYLLWRLVRAVERIADAVADGEAAVDGTPTE